MADTTNGIFTNGDDSAAVYTGGSYGTDEQDFEKWTDWKQIKAAITGSAAVEKDNASKGANANGLVDAESLRKAANVFNQAQLSVATVAENLRQQARGLAGEGRPWQGKAAEAFLAKMETLSEYLDAQADRINGGDYNAANHGGDTNGGSVGLNSVPNQLYQSGNRLQWAQNAVNYIDSFYATWAGNNGAKTYDGLVHVSEIPGLPEKIAQEMKAVMRQLAAQYKVNVDSVQTPNPSEFGGASQFPSYSFPSYSTPNLSVPPYPSLSFPSYSFPSTSFPSTSFPSTSFPSTSFPSTSLPSTSLPSTSLPSVSIPGSDVPPPNASVPVPDANVPPPNANVPPPTGFDGPTSTDIPDLTNGPSASIPDVGAGGLPGGDGSGLPGGGLPGFDGGAGGGDGLGAGPIPNLAGLTAPNSLTNPNEQKTNLPTGSIPDLGGADGGTLPDGTTLPDSSLVPPDVTPPTAGSIGDPSGLGGGIPPISGMQPPPSATGGPSEKSDASGLLGGDDSDFKPGAIPGAGLPDAPAGTLPGSTDFPGSNLPGSSGFDLPSGGSGAAGGGVPPMSPMQPPQSSGGGLPEKSDASGLVGGETEPWEGVDIPGSGLPNAPIGTLPGGVGTGAGTGVGAGMPPMSPMQPPQSNGGGLPEKSDASGLIGGEAEPWQPSDLSGAGLPEAPAGTLPGTTLPGATLPGAGLPTSPSATSPGGLGSGMPPMSPMQPPQSNSGGLPEKSDAAGLVSAGTDPWTVTEAPETGEPYAPQGASMPPLAPMSPPPSANAGPAERSDAAGLIEADDGQWQTATPVDGPDAPLGAPPMTAPPPAERERVEKSQAGELIEPENLFAEEAPPPPLATDDHPSPVPEVLPPFLPFGFPGGRPGERDRPQRSKAGEALEEDSPWMPAEAVAGEQAGQGDDGHQDDRVPVVRMTGDDFDSWDSEMLPWVGHEQPAPDDGAAEWGSLQWQDEQVAAAEPDAVPIEPGFAAWRPSKVTAESHTAALAADRPLMSGGPDLTPDELEKLWAERDEETRQQELERRRAAGELVDEDEPEEEDEDESKDSRQAVHLLHQDDRAWGGNAADTGVIG